ncbi:hypothetical protein CcCBS67573_g00804 [Chytriomyces confervae]|uniref:Fibronectin type-III domain-containing protein n=1 Tax=Chytriomyces confervae TaxID=246404 RepID=A0A507FNB8_9FUNG|nr:hypothetical protein CcCBS67573_g00804 [Chytriomyces confervae]
MATEAARDAPSTPAAERAKIYGHAPVESKAHGTTGPDSKADAALTHKLPTDPFLPRVAQTAFHMAHAVEAAATGKHAFIIDQMDRLRAMMHEKDIEILKVRHENMILKQVERRQQKDIEALDNQSHDAPKIIRGLREEISGLKSKVKSYYNQLSSEERRLRTVNDECLKLRDHVSRLEKLASSNQLLERETLSRKLTEALEAVAAYQGTFAEMSRKSDMIEKLLTNENKQLRGKIHNLNAENVFLKDKIRKSTDLGQEKDKEIASLSIYRYNAVHKKPEVAACKKCEKRLKEETDFKRKQLILEKIPVIAGPTVSVKDGNTVQVAIKAPYLNTDASIEYDKLILKVTTDPTFSTICREYDIQVKKDANSDPENSNFSAELTVEGLTSGQYYHFLVIAAKEGIFGTPSEAISVLVDELPDAPLKPMVVHSIIPPVIQLFIEDPVATSKASPATTYQIYHSNESTMLESFLIGEVAVVPGARLSFTYNAPRIGTQHFFKIAAINSMGTSAFSEVSDAVLMDCPPNRPHKPHITKLDSKSIHISTSCDSNGGTDIESWRIVYTKTEPTNSERTPVPITLIAKATGTHMSLDHVIDGLQPGENYVFTVFAVSPGGESEASDHSDEVNLDMMIPTPDPPEIELISATCVHFVFPKNASAKYGERPKILGYSIRGSSNSGQNADLSVTCAVGEPIDLSSVPGASYKFSMALCGENSEEGEFSEASCVHLAAAIPLPPSPDVKSDPSSCGSVRDDPDAPAPAQLKKHKSRSLSLVQRSQNMHDGNPAYHDPADPETSVSLAPVENAPLDGRPSRKAKSIQNLRGGHGAQPARTGVRVPKPSVSNR